jgi:hypothetical protein
MPNCGVEFDFCVLDLVFFKQIVVLGRLIRWNEYSGQAGGGG